MRRLRNDDGAVAVLVAILAVAMFGFGALVIDVGALYNERRQLQNGADSAALAVAQSCAGGKCGPFLADADDFADDNAQDGAARIPAEGVCGSVAAGLPACSDPPSGLAGAGYVRVTTGTEEPGGATQVPPLLARVIAPDYDGTDVSARATVIWGTPGGLASAIPVTMSACEWKKFTSAGLAPPPDYDTHPTFGYSTAWLTSAAGGKTYERTFYTHNASKDTQNVAVTCPATPPGGDAAGSFGWLADTDSSCSAETSLSPDGELGYENQPGNTVPSVCKKGDFPKVGTIVYVPVYDYFTVKGTVTTTGGGNKVWYHVDNYAAFYVTGYNLQLPGGGDQKSIVTGKSPCSSSDRCMSGFFTTGTAPSAGPVVSGPSYGANITQLVR